MGRCASEWGGAHQRGDVLTNSDGAAAAPFDCRVIKNCGFGHRTAPAGLQQMLFDLLGGKQPASLAADDSSNSLCPSLAADESAKDSAATAARTKGFLNRLFNTVNWTLTEFTVCVGDLHNLRGRRSILEAQNQYRRTGLMFELSVNFLRILEFVVVSWPTLTKNLNSHKQHNALHTELQVVNNCLQRHLFLSCSRFL